MSIPQSNLDDLMKNPKAAGLLKNQALLQSILQSPDTKKLMQMLSQSSGGHLQHTAESAAKGDTQALSNLVRQVMGSEEGSRLVQQLNQKISQGK